MFRKACLGDTIIAFDRFRPGHLLPRYIAGDKSKLYLYIYDVLNENDPDPMSRKQEAKFGLDRYGDPVKYQRRHMKIKNTAN